MRAQNIVITCWSAYTASQIIIFILKPQDKIFENILFGLALTLINIFFKYLLRRMK